jgi:hypothetical protein
MVSRLRALVLCLPLVGGCHIFDSDAPPVAEAERDVAYSMLKNTANALELAATRRPCVELTGAAREVALERYAEFGPISNDVWRRPVRAYRLDESWVVESAGSDGKVGTADDLKVVLPSAKLASCRTSTTGR